MARQNRPMPLEFPFPFGGIDESGSYRSQPPYTTTDCQNVRPEGPIESRIRGGTRPGLRKAYAEQLGSGGPIRMLAEVTNVGNIDGGYYFYWDDEFNRTSGSTGPGWAALTGTTGGQMPTTINMIPPLVDRVQSASVHDTLDPDFSTSSAYTISINVIPFGGEHWGTYNIYARMNDTTPTWATSGIRVSITSTGTGGAYTGIIRNKHGGVLVDDRAFSGTLDGANADPFRLSVNISGNWVTVSVDDTTVASGPVSSGHGTNHRFGVGATTTSRWPTGISLIDNIEILGTPSGGEALQKRRTYLCAIAGGKFYAERTIGQMTQVTGDAADFSDSHLIHAVELGQKLYIAEYDPPKIAGTDGTLSLVGTRLTATAVTNWAGYEIDKDTDVVVITGATTPAENGTYKITGVGPAAILLAGTGALGNSSCSYRIERGPKVYDPATNTVSIWSATADKGEVPTGAQLITLYRNRIVLAASLGTPHLWWVSRQGDALDWDYTATDDGRPIPGTNADAGEMGDVQTALMQFSDDYCVFGCKGSVYVLRGDPAWGGDLDALSYATGVIDKGAICTGASGEMYFLGWDGMYVIQPGAQGRPQPLSRDKVPERLVSIDPAVDEVLMAWDEVQQGVHIWVSAKGMDAATGTALDHYFFDPGGGGYFRDTNWIQHGPTAVHGYQTQLTPYRWLILGGRDGYLRRYDVSLATDDGETLTAYTLLPPVRLGGSEFHEGILQQLDGTLADGSGDVDWEVRVGRTHSEAHDATAFTTGTWTGDGLQHTVRPRARGGSCVLKIGSSDDNRKWSVEAIVGLSIPAGRTRVG